MVVSFNTDALNGLCSKDQLELLDAVDRLRLQGIDHYISLPQIIVCGDQSSGKSSVLEAISGVPFPVKSNLCTRFPTELILRTSRRADVTVSIIPHKSSDKEPLSAFHEKLDGFDGLPNLIESAKIAMGISMQGKGFSKDLLRIEISGPQHPHLTIVDLPGLIHSATKQQSASDVDLVTDVVQTYMKQPRSIILAVVSAKNDFANQIVLKLARYSDPDGKRTLGVITKPDTLVEGSDTEKMYVSLAENKEVEFNLGWHVLRNLDSEKIDGSSLLHRRNEEEEAFFSEGVWSRLPSSMLGVKELRTRLNEVLLQQIATELPSLITEIDDKLRDCINLLVQLGEPRATVRDQRLFLLSLSEKFHRLIYDVNNGTYTDTFFKPANTHQGYQQRLRAVIQELNREFSDTMLTHGHARHIGPEEDRVHRSNVVSRDKFIDEVQELMRRTRGRELPGRFNSLIVTDLFLEQSKPWKSIVVKHVDRCWGAAKQCLTLVTGSIAEGSIGVRLLRRVVFPALDNVKGEIALKASEIINSQVLCHPVTYNEQYLQAVHRINDQRRREFYSKAVEEIFGIGNSTQIYITRTNLDALVERLSQRRELDDERVAASEAVDCMEAYYSVALKRIVDDVAIEVIERKLMSALSEIFSPVGVFNMTEDLVSAIAGESQESRAKRTRLTNQVEILVKGSETCKRFAGIRLGDAVPSIEDDIEDIEDIDDIEDGASVMSSETRFSSVEQPALPVIEVYEQGNQIVAYDSLFEEAPALLSNKAKKERKKKSKKNAENVSAAL